MFTTLSLDLNISGKIQELKDNETCCKTARIIAGFLELDKHGRQLVGVVKNTLALEEAYQESNGWKALNAVIKIALTIYSPKLATTYKTVSSLVYQVAIERSPKQIILNIAYIVIGQKFADEFKVMMIVQGIASKCIKAAKLGFDIESLANLVQAFISGYINRNEFHDLYLKRFGKEFTQEDCDQLMEHVDKSVDVQKQPVKVSNTKTQSPPTEKLVDIPESEKVIDTSPVKQKVLSPAERPAPVQTSLHLPSVIKEYFRDLGIPPLDKIINHLNFFKVKEGKDCDVNQLFFKLRKIEQEEFDKRFDIQLYLKENGFSNVINHVRFRNFTDLEIRHIKFKNCIFNEIEYSSFYDVTFESSKFTDGIYYTDFVSCYLQECNLSNLSIDLCDFECCVFNRCDLLNLDLSSSRFSQVLFVASKISGWMQAYVTFMQVHFIECIFKKIDFLNNRISESAIIDSEGEDVLIGDDLQVSSSTFEKKSPVIVVPTDLGYEAEWVADPVFEIEKAGGFLHPFEYYLDVKLNKMNKELKKLLPSIYKSDSQASIFEQLFNKIDESTPTLLKIKQHCELHMKHADGVFIPGGDDVEKMFYKKTQRKNIETWGTCDLVQGFALIIARLSNKARYGECRGAQLICAVDGGKIRNVSTGFQKGYKLFEVTKDAVASLPFLSKIQKVVGAVCHSQRCDLRGAKGLRAVIQNGEIPEAIVGPNTFAVQYHPEFTVDASFRTRTNQAQAEASRAHFSHFVNMCA